ncbi:hypothetical protein JTE90_018278 [Oedothorax gibbosus]|uniref:Protein Spindly n=1 Tax=Oedothorax gibbosus TaxID=931172 RepID=A0AAV6UYP4_9ARAC|nr:hypothetical protein JTE90_018278 [Oedothorax gibbosus]
MESEYLETIARLKNEIFERDSDIQKAATFGKQLLEDKQKLSEKLQAILLENERLQQDKYSLQLDLETQVQTLKSHSSEYENLNENFNEIKKQLELLQKEKNSQKHRIKTLTDENEDLEKNLQKALQEKSDLNKKVVSQQQQIQSLQYKAEVSLNISLQQTLLEEEDIDYYKLQNKQLQEALAEVQFELTASQSNEVNLLAMVKELEEGIKDRDNEIKACTMEIKRASELQNELQGEIEVLKLEQLDVNRRGNSVYGELDDRRKLVEKEYKLLVNKYENMLVNYENNKQELSNCKCQMAILLSMTSRNYHTSYIKKLEDNLMESKREIDNLNAKFKSLVQSQMQHQLGLDQVLKGADEYGYLKVMYEQAEKKNKSLEYDLFTHRMQNSADKDNLISTQQHLYQTQAELDSVKIENMKLKQDIRELTMKPDVAEEDEKKIRIEVLPGYNVSSKDVENLKAEMSNKNTSSGDIIPGEFALIDGEFQEVKKPTLSNRAILRNSINNQTSAVSKDKVQEKLAFSPEVKFLRDSEVEAKENAVEPPSYGRYRTGAQKRRNNQQCQQQ